MASENEGEKKSELDRKLEEFCEKVDEQKFNAKFRVKQMLEDAERDGINLVTIQAKLAVVVTVDVNTQPTKLEVRM